MRQDHVIVKPADIASMFPRLVGEWMHGRMVEPVRGRSAESRIMYAMWRKPSKADRRLYSGAIMRVS